MTRKILALLSHINLLSLKAYDDRFCLKSLQIQIQYKQSHHLSTHSVSPSSIFTFHKVLHFLLQKLTLPQICSHVHQLPALQCCFYHLEEFKIILANPQEALLRPATMSAAFHFSGTIAALSNRLHSTAVNAADSHVLVEILGVTANLRKCYCSFYQSVLTPV